MTMQRTRKGERACISAKAPRAQAKIVLLGEMEKAGGGLDTRTLVTNAMARFPELTSTELRRKVNGREPWWPGRFRFDLNSLKRKGEARNPKKGWWEISPKGRQRLSSVRLPPATTPVRKLKELRGRLLASAQGLEEVVDILECVP